MLDKDKIIIVVYVGVLNIEYQLEAIDNVRRGLIDYFDESVKLIFAPDYNKIGITFDCINPVLLNDKEYKKVQKNINKIEELVNQLNEEKTKEIVDKIRTVSKQIEEKQNGKK